nr:MAG TPA: hypothetical protein [Caudoviricetes sp.]DAP81180.1 MAG TPA: hypothetical protein [Caudoviricetes sp.]DAV12697.1 MAG TPA: hypothetical protein [Caudoviricetes sp.]DAX33049.1 MAG TPA: hypothetical protein [Caudoviricetes sp.]
MPPIIATSGVTKIAQINPEPINENKAMVYQLISGNSA